MNLDFVTSKLANKNMQPLTAHATQSETEEGHITEVESCLEETKHSKRKKSANN